MYLDILHVFYTYPKRVQDTFWDTHQIHQDTCILGASLVSHWIHIKIHQETCILDSSSRYITINQDTYAGYICGIHSEIHTSWMYPERYVSEMQDTCGIHARYMYLQGWSRYIWDTSEIHDEIHVSQIHPGREMYLIWRRHAGYMQDTCGTRISGVWGYPSAAASRARDTYLEVYLDVSHMYLECILCVTYLRVKIHCILNVS